LPFTSWTLPLTSFSVLGFILLLPLKLEFRYRLNRRKDEGGYLFTFRHFQSIIC